MDQSSLDELLAQAEEVPLRRILLEKAGRVNLAAPTLHPTTGRSDVLLVESQLALENDAALIKFGFSKDSATFHVLFADVAVYQSGPFTYVTISPDSRFLVIAQSNDESTLLVTVDMLRYTGSPQDRLIRACCSPFRTGAGPLRQIRWHPTQPNVVGVLRGNYFEIIELRHACTLARHQEQQVGFRPLCAPLCVAKGDEIVDVTFLDEVLSSTGTLVVAMVTALGEILLHSIRLSQSLLDDSAAQPPAVCLRPPVSATGLCKRCVSLETLLTGTCTVLCLLWSDGLVESVGVSGASTAACALWTSGGGPPLTETLDQCQLDEEVACFHSLIRLREQQPTNSCFTGTSVLAACGSQAVYLLQFLWVTQIKRTPAANLLSPPPLIPTVATKLNPAVDDAVGWALTSSEVLVLRPTFAEELPVMSGLNTHAWDTVSAVCTMLLPTKDFLVNQNQILDFQRAAESLCRVAGTDSSNGDNLQHDEAQQPQPTALRAAEGSAILKAVKQELEQLSSVKLFNKVVGTVGGESSSAAASTDAVLYAIDLAASRVARIIAVLQHLRFVTQRLLCLTPTVGIAGGSSSVAKNWEVIKEKYAKTEKQQELLVAQCERVTAALRTKIETLVCESVSQRYGPLLLDAGPRLVAKYMSYLISKRFA